MNWRRSLQLVDKDCKGVTSPEFEKTQLQIHYDIYQIYITFFNMHQFLPLNHTSARQQVSIHS
jgi:hypothetical protein